MTLKPIESENKLETASELLSRMAGYIQHTTPTSTLIIAPDSLALWAIHLTISKESVNIEESPFYPPNFPLAENSRY